MPTSRLFIAVPLPPSLEDKWGGLIAPFSSHPAVRWVSPRQMHVTLRFIGDLEDDLLLRLAGALTVVSASQGSFQAELGGLGGFPNLLKPKVLFGPILEGEKSFRILSRAISERLMEFGVPKEKNYHPHVTLGRVREGADVSSLVHPLRLNLEWVSDTWLVDQFILFSSRLTPEGPLYTRIKEFKLGG